MLEDSETPDLEETSSSQPDELKRARDTVESLLKVVEIGSEERDRAFQALDRLTSVLDERDIEIDNLHKEIDRRRLLQRKHLQVNVQLQRFIGEQFQNSLAQHLVATRMSVSSLLKKQKRGSAVTAKDLEQLSDYLKVAENEARSLAQGIIPIESEGLDGLIAALELLVKRVRELWDHLDCRLEVVERLPIQDDFITLKLYYIAREAVNNALRHAQAHTIIVRLKTGEQGETILEVEDDGIGIDTDRLKQNSGLGLEIMQLRSEIIEGQLEIKPGREGGTLIRCTLQPTEN